MRKLAAIVLVSALSLAYSYSYTVYPPITGDGNLAVTPAFFSDKTNSGGMETYLFYGMTDKMDICASMLSYNGSSSFAAMLRYDFGGSKIVALRGNASWVVPQFSLSIENDRLLLQTNVAAQITYDYAKDPAFYAVLCPGLKLFKGIDIYCEINPGYYLHDGDFANLWVRSKGFDLDIVPGVGFSIGKALFSVGIPLYNVTSDPTPTFGAWFYYTITTK